MEGTYCTAQGENYKVDNFMKGRVTYSITDDYVGDAKGYIERYKKYKPYCNLVCMYLLVKQFL